MTKQQIYKMVVTITTAIVTCVAIALGLSSCNVTRTSTTKSEYWQKADTSVVIQTKTIETYDASKNRPLPVADTILVYVPKLRSGCKYSDVLRSPQGL